MSSSLHSVMLPGPPYPPTTAALGGVPTISVDVPICSVFLALFTSGAVAHMTLFQRNRKRGHKFIPSAVTFGFCMARIVTNSLRIAWACHPTNLQLAIAAQIFVSAGVLLLFILNLIYAQRMLRATHPVIGWSRLTSILFKAIWVLLVFTLAMVITVTVQSFYSLNPNTHRIDRDVELYAISFLLVISFLPLPILAFVQLAPRKGKHIDNLGTGSWFSKVIILGATSFLLCLGATFRAAVNYETPRPTLDPAGYQSKACFYIFNFSIEIVVVFIYLFARVDLRFHVPDGSSKVRHYGPLSVKMAESGVENGHETEDGPEA